MPVIASRGHSGQEDPVPDLRCGIHQDAALKLAIDILSYEPTDDLRLKAVTLFEKKEIPIRPFVFDISKEQQTLSDELEKRLKKLQHDKDPKADDIC